MTGLTEQFVAWIDAAQATLDGAALLDLTARMVDIPSPSGEEAALAEFLVRFMNDAGLEAFYQPLDDHQGNAIGRLRGSGGGADLMLYAPLDTAFAGTEDEDHPWLGATTRSDQIAKAVVDDGVVSGLGAHNPKGHGAAALMAVIALLRARVPLRGDVVVAFGAGGMPTNRRPGAAGGRFDVGHGAGCAFMLEQGIRGDFAIVAKPGPVAWEEVGLCWFRVRVNGLLGYAGTRHVVRHLNPIVEATKVIAGLEQWFPKYAERNASGAVRPQGSIGCIRAGWPNKPTFIPETCEIYLDLRVSPRTEPIEARRQFAEAMDGIRTTHDTLDLDWEMILAIPGSHTDPDNWIIGSAIRAWERMTGAPYDAGSDSSGATESNILRAWGVPTARFGMPPPPRPLPHSGMFSMGEAHVDSLMALSRGLITATVDTCARPLEDVGL